MKAKVMLPTVLLLMPGCAAPGISRGPEIRVKKTDSASVSVNVAALEHEGAGVFVEGYLSKNRRADSTASAHLDVFGYDAQGTRIAEQLVAFTPGEISASFRGFGGRTRYRILLNFPLTKVAQVEVQAHEGGHPTR